MRTVTLNRQLHVSLLADHTKDPIAKELLKAGDVVVVCAGCKTVYLKDVWAEMLNGKCSGCGNIQTTDQIPNREYISIEKRKAVTTRVEHHYSYGWVIFFVLVSIAIGIYAWSIKGKYEEEQERSAGLENEISRLNTANVEARSQLTNLTKQKGSMAGSYAALADQAKSVLFVTGIKYTDRASYQSEFANVYEKVYFTVRYPIVLKSLKVDARGSGYLKVKLHDEYGNVVAQAVNNEITDGIELVHFNQPLNPGRYYLSHEGDTELLYNIGSIRYPIKTNGPLEITGTDYEENRYMYYYEWECSLLPPEV